ncbi:cysteine synthase CysM [Algiphilus sp.]|uniref:cysteine synthase CysM n=2 Tax=Algiphilus sp. TaxID=1872431 RepID=UPI0025BF2C0F|nr:cysteine synthase CysM [Algiphilus sp.]MCK5771606.1 cysteine synthase CysM [Algiphilus sp.]
MLTDFIGNTPLVRVTRLDGIGNNRLYVKLEGNNPAGSVKDRPAWSMIRHAQERGEIQPGDRLIEATSGNTGIALAMVAAAAGYRMTLVMPSHMSAERSAVMRAFGAEIVHVSEAEGMEGARDVAEQMQREGRGRVLDQFANPDNPRAHYEGTAPEIWRDTGQTLTHFVATMGTTGTIMGCSRFYKEYAPGVQVVGVHPDGESSIPGIRKWPEAYQPKIYQPAAVDRIIECGADAAENTMRELARREGIFCGPSSGGSVWAALQLCAELENATVAAIICDRGDRYISTGVFPS